MRQFAADVRIAVTVFVNCIYLVAACAAPSFRR